MVGEVGLGSEVALIRLKRSDAANHVPRSQGIECGAVGRTQVGCGVPCMCCELAGNLSDLRVGISLSTRKSLRIVFAGKGLGSSKLGNVLFVNVSSLRIL